VDEGRNGEKAGWVGDSKSGTDALDFRCQHLGNVRDMDYIIKVPYLAITSLLPMGYPPKKWYGLWVMGYGYKFPAYRHGKSKKVWVMREYGLSRVWVLRESTVITNIATT